jgi:signal transduction histidine kinase
LNMQVRAKRMGGDLTVTSASEKGARLVLKLPLRRKGA